MGLEEVTVRRPEVATVPAEVSEVVHRLPDGMAGDAAAMVRPVLDLDRRHRHHHHLDTARILTTDPKAAWHL
jgi:hypothetical protein